MLLLGVALAAPAWAQDPFTRPTPIRPSDEEAEARDEEVEPLPEQSDSRRVVIGGFDGELAAAGRSARFLAALQGAFAEEEFRAEKSRDGAGPWKPAGKARNRFGLLEGDGAKDAWMVHLVADSLHAQPAGLAGVRVVIAVLSPQAVRLNARPLPLREDLVFDPGAMKLDFVAAAGRVAALRILEQLHHLDGQLDSKARLVWPGRASGLAKPAAVE